MMQKGVAQKLGLAMAALVAGGLCGYIVMSATYKKPAPAPAPATSIVQPRDDSFTVAINDLVGGGATGETVITRIEASGTITRQTTPQRKPTTTTTLGVTTFDKLNAIIKELSPEFLQSLAAKDKGAQPGCHEWVVTRMTKEYTIHFCAVPDELKTADRLATDIITTVLPQ